MGQSTGYNNNNNNKDVAEKGPLKCWECGEPHYLRDCPVKRRNSAPNLHAIQRETIVGDLAREPPNISVALENRQADHQTSMVEVEGMIKDKPISILIDPGASLSYVSPSIAEICSLQQEKFRKPWMVQLATGMKRKVFNYVKDCEVIMSGFKTPIELNVLPLGSYDVLIGMDWLENHRVVLNYFEKTFTCLNEEGNTILVKGIPRKTSVRQISASQMKRAARKGCKVFVVYVINF